MFKKYLYLSVFVGLLLTSCQSEPKEAYFPHDSSNLAAEAEIEYGCLPNGVPLCSDVKRDAV